ncbi:MAG: Ldh family oxidoreductase [Planctomycetales bacterium]
MPRFTAESLENLAVAIFHACGALLEEARTVAHHLVEANLAGHDSHGVMRILQYVREIDTGAIVPGTEPKVHDEWDQGAIVDARGAFGQVACRFAMQRAIELAGRGTAGVVTLRHCGHSGRLGAYVAQAAEAGMFGMVAANGGGAGQWVAPFGGREGRLSTNPLAMGAPAAGKFPVILDFSTSVVPEGKVRDAVQRGKRVPDGWLVDPAGRPTNDPTQLYGSPRGAILPFGGSSGHKGFSLAFMVDLLAGVLSAAGFPRRADADPANGTGLFLLALNIERFVPRDQFARHVGEMMAYVKSSPPAEGFSEVYIPGEIEHRHRRDRLQRGIEIPDRVWDELQAIIERLNNPARLPGGPGGSTAEFIAVPRPLPT